MERKLELKDIAGYLPYGLKIMDIESELVYPFLGYEIDTTLTKILLYDEEADWWNLSNFKPILRQLSDLYRTITHNGKEIVPILELGQIAFPYFKFELWQGIAVVKDEIGIITAKFRFEQVENYFSWTGDGVVKRLGKLFDYLHELKIDYLGLIDAGLAIDVNTLDVNCYK